MKFTKSTKIRCKMTTAAKTLLALTVLLPSISHAAVIKDISHSNLPGEKVQVVVTTDVPVKEPLSFVINEPARIAFDFLDTTSQLGKKRIAVNSSYLKDIFVASTGSRTRLVLNLDNMALYQSAQKGNQYTITLQPQGSTSSSGYQSASIGGSNVKSALSNQPMINKVDYRRGEKGEGRLIIGLSDRNTPVNVYQKGGKVYAEFAGADIGKGLAQRLDVLDFATPAKTIDINKTKRGVVFAVTPVKAAYEHIAYQSDDVFTLELKPVSRAEQQRQAKEKFGFTGERLSLNFQDIDTRTVLQLISDFTGTNVVVSDTVGGTLTLRLKDVPWDQALDIILKTKGLDKRESGNVMLIAPSAELAQMEKITLEAQKQAQELAPVISEFVNVNYAKADDIANVIRETSNGNSDDDNGVSSLLSPRGSMTVDTRTNTILIKDTAESIAGIRRVIERLDVPVKQVLIESRIVSASEEFSKSLGARIGVQGGAKTGSTSALVSSKIADPSTTPGVAEALNFSGAGSVGTIGLSIAKLADSSLLALELSALQAEGNGEVISTPRVITADRQAASIEQGVEVPYLEAAASGAASVAFKKAVLSLNVTPQVTPEGSIVLDLSVSQDSVGRIYQGTPSIDTLSTKTQVLVDDGETVVLGGIFIDETTQGVTKVPFFGDLPGIGRFFRSNDKKHQKKEILIFVTPKIIKSKSDIN